MDGHDYRYGSSDAPHTADYLLPIVKRMLQQVRAKRVLDLGCGNGAMCAALAAAGYQVTGFDPSAEGIALAKATYPDLTFHQLSVYEPPPLGCPLFDAVVSTEVVEHLYYPRALPAFARHVLRPAGHLIVSTPYHGYLKNLTLSMFDKWDSHLSPFWDGGHIKFWSRDTLSKLVVDEGFDVKHFAGAGRIPYLWKSMLLLSQSPSNPAQPSAVV